jgi:dTDP-glucose pyrophosphorylase
MSEAVFRTDARIALEHCLVSPETSLREAMQRMTDAQTSIVLVADADHALKGVVVDGDIRRALLRNPDIEQPVEGIMTPHPRTAPFNISEQDLRALAERALSPWLPLVDQSGKVRGLVDLYQLRQRRQALPNAAIIMAGGRGQRLWPHTADTPKPLMQVGERPILETLIRILHGHGFRRFYLSVNYLAEHIEAHFGDGASLGADIRYLREDQPLGTAGGLRELQGREELPFLVINGDVLSRFNACSLLDFHVQEDAVATVALRDYTVEVPFGVVETDGTRFVEIREKPSHHVQISTGIYVIDPKLLNLLPEARAFDMPELLAAAAKSFPNRVACFQVADYWVDIGSEEDLQKARLDFTKVF